jgi:hypothetical protein
MFVENTFDTHITDDDAEHFGGPFEVEERLEQHLSKQRPKQDTAKLLRKLAETQQRPELARVWTECGGASKLAPSCATSSASEHLRWNFMKCFCYRRSNLAENSMRPVALGRRNWIHIGSTQAGPKVAAILAVVESCRRLKLPVRDYLAASRSSGSQTLLRLPGSKQSVEGTSFDEATLRAVPRDTLSIGGPLFSHPVVKDWHSFSNLVAR